MTDLEEKLGIDAERLGRHADPLSAAMCVIGAVTALRELTGWREDWGERTTLGRVGLVLGAPVRIATGVFCALMALTFAIVMLVEVLVTAGPSYLYRGYKRRAFKD